jgi:hypothetical protein
VPLIRTDVGPLEHELAMSRYLPPQRRERIQTGNDALDVSRVLYSQYGRRPTGIGLLTMLPSPRDIAKRGEALRLRHFG